MLLRLFFNFSIFVCLFTWKTLDGFRMQRNWWSSLRTWNPQRVSDSDLELDLKSDKLWGQLDFFSAPPFKLHCTVFTRLGQVQTKQGDYGSNVRSSKDWELSRLQRVCPNNRLTTIIGSRLLCYKKLHRQPSRKDLIYIGCPCFV